MKKSSLLIAVFALAVSAFASMGSQAASPCGTTTRNAQDPFGSCEKSSGSGAAYCDPSATKVGPVASVDNTASGGQGVEGCASGSDALPIHGRLGVYVSSSNDVTVFADGDDLYSGNSGGAAGWDRLDVKTSKQEVCFRRGSAGSYWTSGGGTSSPDSVNFAADKDGPRTSGPCK